MPAGPGDGADASAPSAPAAAAAAAGIVDYERMLRALLSARSAFGPETELRRIENLPVLTLWHSVMRLEVAVREIRARAAAAPARPAAPVLTRRSVRAGEDD